MYIVYGSSSLSIASMLALIILSTGSESTYDLLSSFTTELWISVHCPSLNPFDCADAVCTAKTVMAAATIIDKRLILSSEITHKYTQFNSYTYRFIIEGVTAVSELKLKVLTISVMHNLRSAKVRNANLISI